MLKVTNFSIFFYKLWDKNFNVIKIANFLILTYAIPLVDLKACNVLMKQGIKEKYKLLLTRNNEQLRGWPWW